MKNAIIIHGMPSKEEYFSIASYKASEQHWLPWLKERLIFKEVQTNTPEMPEPYEPRYEKWKETFEQFEITSETILVGHSCGGGFLVRWLSENKMKVGQVVIVAPWTDPLPEKELNTGMFDFTIDPELVSRTAGVNIMYSLDDDEVILKTIDELKAALPQATFKEFSDKGHFTLGDMGGVEFPEILEILRI